MQDLNKLDCKIYVETEQKPAELASRLANVVNGTIEQAPGAVTIRALVGEVELLRNDDAERRRAPAFPDGFLYFSHVIELYAFPETPLEKRVSLVASLLGVLWSNGLPAVASCDYEGQLPKQGGYKDSSVPWPLGGGFSEGSTRQGAPPDHSEAPVPGASETPR